MQKTSSLTLSVPTLDEDTEQEIDEDAAVGKAGQEETRQTRPQEREEKGRSKSKIRKLPRRAPRPESVSLERTKNFSGVRADVAGPLRSFEVDWKRVYSREKPPSAKWLVSTMLARFLEGDAVAQIAGVRLANLQAATSNVPESTPREDYSFRASAAIIARIEEVVTEWNRDEDAPRISHAWLLEAAYFDFVGEGGDLVRRAAETLAAKLEKRAAAGR